MLSGCLCKTVHFFHCCRLPVCHMISREKTRDMQRNFPAGKRPDRCNPFSLLLLHFWYPVIFTWNNWRCKLHMTDLRRTPDKFHDGFQIPAKIPVIRFRKPSRSIFMASVRGKISSNTARDAVPFVTSTFFIPAFLK